MQQIRPKLTYRPKASIEVFYTGGAVSLASTGLLACACGDDVKLVDSSTGAVEHTLTGDSEAVTALAFSSNGAHLFSASRSLQLRAWDAKSGQQLSSWKGHKAPVMGMAVDPSGAMLATASADSTVKVWDTAGTYCTHSFAGHSGVVFTVLFHPKDLMLFSGGEDSDVRVWDLNTKSCVAALKGHFSAVTSLSLSSDSWTLVSAGRDKVVQAWDVRKHRKLTTVPVYEAVEGVVALPATSSFPGMASATGSSPGRKPTFFATGGEKGQLKIWQADSGQCVYEQAGMDLVQGGGITHLELLPKGAGLLVATADCRLLFFSQQDSAPELTLARQLIGNNDQITDVRFLGPPGTPTHMAVATNSEHIRIYSLGNMGCTATLAGHQDTVLCLDATAVGSSATPRSLLASGAKDSMLRVWDGATGAALAVAEGHIAAVSAVAFSCRSAKYLASGGADKILKVWDLTAVLEGPQHGKPHKKGGKTVPPAQILGGRALKLPAMAATAAHDKDINSVAFSPNDALLCTGSQDRTAKVWRMPDLVLTVTLRGHRRGIWAVAFSPVDQCVATASGDKTLRLWALSDGSCLKTFEGHTASVLRLNFLSAGTQLLSSGADGLLKLWSVKSTECLNTFDEHEDKIWALAVGGSAESLVATGGGDATIHLWEDTTAADQAAAAEQAQQAVLKQQDLSNALQAEDFAGAAALAFELRQPGRLLSVVNKAQEKGPAACQRILAQLVADFDGDSLRMSLEYAREWNTNARHCHAAQALLQATLLQHPPETLLGVPGMSELVEALLSYTQRHFARVDRLVRASFLVDYTLSAMKVVLPDAAAAAEQPAARELEVGQPGPAGSAGSAEGAALQRQPAAQQAEKALMNAEAIKAAVHATGGAGPDRAVLKEAEEAVEQDVLMANGQAEALANGAAAGHEEQQPEDADMASADAEAAPQLNGSEQRGRKKPKQSNKQVTAAQDTLRAVKLAKPKQKKKHKVSKISPSE